MPSTTLLSTYSADSIRIRVKDYEPFPQPVRHGTEVVGVYFDGYPQIVKHEGSRPTYGISREKNRMVPMRDGVRLAIDVYRPSVEGEKFPAILAWGPWGKDLQEAVGWWPKPQAYYDTPFWDGMMEGGDYRYTVPRGYAHLIPEPRGKGNSEGVGSAFGLDAQDIYDTIEWVAAQPWCNGNVGMMGPSAYSIAQMIIAQDPPPHLKALSLDESIAGTGEHFHGIFDTLVFHIITGRHGNDSGFVPPSRPHTVLPPETWRLPKEDLEQRLEEALNHPDIRFNSKWYSLLKYPLREPTGFDMLLSSFHPRPGMVLGSPGISRVRLPARLGTPWGTRLYIWGTFEAYESISTPGDHKKLIVYPPGFPHRPYVQYHDEIVRWYDFWLKGIDTGVIEEPPIKLFVMGVNKWKFEREWPLARTSWTKFYFHPGGRLSPAPVTDGAGSHDSFTQPAPYLDPTVYCLRYTSEPFAQDTEVTGPMSVLLEASIDTDDTNWMVDLVDVGPDGDRQLLSQGYLKAAHRALDESRSQPYRPVHPRQDPIPVPLGERLEYAIAMMPTANIFCCGHRMEIIIRNQDDLLSRLGGWGVYMLPFMRTVTHTIHLGKSHILVPVIPASGERPTGLA